MKVVWFVVLMLALTGCATGLGVTGMSPEQLTEFAKNKDATLSCVKGVYAGVSVTATFVNVDKGIPAGVTIKDSCEISFDSTVKPK